MIEIGRVPHDIPRPVAGEVQQGASVGAGEASGEGEQPLGLPSSGRVLGAGAAAVAQFQVVELGARVRRVGCWRVRR